MPWAVGRWAEGLRALVVVLALFAAAGAAAQQVVVDSYQQEQGLANLTAQAVEQDRRGALWIGTENGLFRFDGFRVEQVALPAGAGAWVTVVRSDAAGRLWVATGEGLFMGQPTEADYRWSEVRSETGEALLVALGQRLDIDRTGVVHAMDEHNTLWRIAALPDDGMRAVARRVVLPSYGTWPPAREAAGGPVRAFDSGALWFGCGRALCELRDGRLRRWAEQEGVPPRAWAALVQGLDGSLWARSADLLLRLQPGEQRFDAVAAPPAWRWSGTIALAQDAAGRIITATDEGLASWDGRHWRHWTPQRNGLPETSVRVLMFDAEGSLWLGTSGRGLHRWIGWGRVEHWTSADGLPSPVVWGSARDRQRRLWVATSHGLARFDTQAGRFRPVPHAGHASAWGLQADAAGNVLWRVEKSLLAARGGSDRVFAVSGEAVSRSDVFVGGQGRVYLLGDERVSRLVVSRAGMRVEPLADNPRDERFESVAYDGVDDWFVSSRALYRREGAQWKPLLDEQGRMVDAQVFATFVSPSQVWVVDSHGVSAYDVKDGVARRLHRYGKDRLGGFSPMFLQADAGGRVWLGTDRGVMVHDNGRWSSLDRSNGLLWNDLSSFALKFDDDGTAWIGTSAGLTQLRPEWHGGPPPRLQLERLEFGSRTFKEPPRDRIGWDDRHLRATVASADFSRVRSMRAEYRLDGDGESWRQVAGNVLHIDSIPPGHHLLELRATGPLGDEQAGPVLRIPFEVAPPWWLSTPAKLGYAALLCGLWALSTFATNRHVRARQLALERAVAERTTALDASQQALRELSEYNARALEEERKHVSRELHDELGQQLAALRMEVSVLGLQAGDQPPLKAEHVDMLVDRVDRLVRSLRGLVTQLRPPALDGGLAAALNWLVEEFRRGTGMACELELEAEHELAPDQATMVFRIAQESLTNIRRHAGASHVTMRLECSSERVVLSVRDDGLGFDAAARADGYGLLGMQERARLLGGELGVTSAPGAGTTVRLCFTPLRDTNAVDSGAVP